MSQSSSWRLLITTALVYILSPTASQVRLRKTTHVATRGAPLYAFRWTYSSAISFRRPDLFDETANDEHSTTTAAIEVEMRRGPKRKTRKERRQADAGCERQMKKNISRIGNRKIWRSDGNGEAGAISTTGSHKPCKFADLLERQYESQADRRWDTKLHGPSTGGQLSGARSSQADILISSHIVHSHGVQAWMSCTDRVGELGANV